MNIYEEIEKALTNLQIGYLPGIYDVQAENGILCNLDSNDNYPICFHALEDSISYIENGMIERTMRMYMFDLIEPTTENIVSDILPIKNALELMVRKFARELDKTVTTTLLNQESGHHLMAETEWGQRFEIKCKYFEPCS
jgi:hypothetical protein